MHTHCGKSQSRRYSARIFQFHRVRGLVAALLMGPLLTTCAPPPPPVELVPTPTSHNYGQVFVGTTADSVPVQWASRSAASVNIDFYSLDPPGPFALKNAQPGQPITVQPGASAPAVTFTFTPTSAGIVATDATPSVLAGAANRQPVALTGEGVFQMSRGDLAVGGRNLVAGAALDFGTVPVGGEMLREFRLTNLSGVDITVKGSFVKAGPVSAGVTPTSPFILVAPTPPFVLPATTSFVVAVIFRPTAPGVFTDAITFTDTANPASFTGTSLIGRAE